MNFFILIFFSKKKESLLTWSLWKRENKRIEGGTQDAKSSLAVFFLSSQSLLLTFILFIIIIGVVVLRWSHPQSDQETSSLLGTFHINTKSILKIKHKKLLFEICWVWCLLQLAWENGSGWNPSSQWMTLTDIWWIILIVKRNSNQQEQLHASLMQITSKWSAH